MKKHIYPLIILIVIAVTLQSCKQKCDAYNPTVLNNWFPYTTGTTYTFADDSGGTVHYTIDEIAYTQPHEVKTGFNQKYFCEVNGMIIANPDKQDPSDMRLHIEHTVQGDDGQYPERLSIYFLSDLFWLGTNESEIDEFRGTDDSVKYSMETLNTFTQPGTGTTYDKTLRIHSDDTSAMTGSTIRTLYIARGTGIIGYVMYPSGREYRLQ